MNKNIKKNTDLFFRAINTCNSCGKESNNLDIAGYCPVCRKKAKMKL